MPDTQIRLELVARTFGQESAAAEDDIVELDRGSVQHGRSAYPENQFAIKASGL
jgi:hypothetical protein